MRILWITNIPLPNICEDMGWPVPSIGGWMYSSLKRLMNCQSLILGVATVYDGKDLIKKKLSDGINYFLLPLNGRKKTSYNSDLEKKWKEVRDSFQPDVVHIHGSEYPHGLAYVNSCGPKGVVLSIQGLVSIVSRYYALPLDTSKKFITFRDIVKAGGVRRERLLFEKSGKYEQQLIKNVSHIIGRTIWDKTHTWAINPNVKYHYCGENLRDSFYVHKWDYKTCIPHTIFVSQGNYPIKGLHQLLKALPLIFREFPDTMVFVAGNNEVSKPWWKITEYGKYISYLLKKNSIEKNVKFTGMVSEKEMLSYYLKANVFVCCSAIENSSNSLGEAQLLGMPYIATYVGGTPEIVDMNEEVLYRYEEYEMLAKSIIDVFKLKENFQPHPCDLSRYDRKKNTIRLIDIYKSIINLD